MQLPLINKLLAEATLKVKPYEAGDFSCYNQGLISLEPLKLPARLTGNFYAAKNALSTLKGSPTQVDGNFNCSRNFLTSLEGAPSEIAGNFICNGNKLTSLKGIASSIKLIKGTASFLSNPIKDVFSVLGVFKIKHVTNVELDDKKAEAIINTHLKGDRNLFDCQIELEEAGYEID